ncbi:MAG: bifunctional 2',3'-cyclic-nucleotide 2'-phosphodiesterase/3'-nucleotidase [Candidatus Bipolaricaulota bacterium]
MLHKNRKLLLSVVVLTALSLVFGFGAMASDSNEYELSILATSDSEQFLMPYNYMQDKPVEDYGYAKTYTLIKEAREEKENTVLISSGDVIAKSLIGTMEARINPIKEGETQNVVKVYNEVGYDSATVGNHELQDYEMAFFEKARAGARFPWISANIKLADSPEETYVEPYTIIEKTINGETLKVGVIGFTPPQTMAWGSSYLEGNIIMTDIVEAAREYIPELKEKSDVIIAAAHTGLSTAPEGSYGARENAGYYLARVDGIDAMILAHDHVQFPTGGYEDVEDIDGKNGTVRGVPTVNAGNWGERLGIIDLKLSKHGDSWKIKSTEVQLREVNENVKIDPMVEEMVMDIHQDTIDYVRKPIAETSREITSFVSRVMDSSVTQIVNDAQLWWAKRTFSEGEYSDLPILSAAAPFKAGRNNPDHFTVVQEGEVTIGNVADIYMYDNSIRVMQLNGNQIIDWLERSAENFNQIDPAASGTQELLNGDFPAFNYDVIEGINYQIDVTKPVGERIVNPTYQGEPLDGDQEFLVVTNDYRAGGGGNFPPCVEEDPVYAPAGKSNRSVIIDYIKEKGEIDPEPTNNWKIKPVDVKGTVTFRSHQDVADYLEKHGIENVEFLRVDENDMGVYRIDLSP